MSMPELYEAYATGKITRGAFIRRMVAFGMTASVAAAYAAAVSPERAHGKAGAGAGRGNLYGDYYRSLYSRRF